MDCAGCKIEDARYKVDGRRGWEEVGRLEDWMIREMGELLAVDLRGGEVGGEAVEEGEASRVTEVAGIYVGAVRVGIVGFGEGSGAAGPEKGNNGVGGNMVIGDDPV